MSKSTLRKEDMINAISAAMDGDVTKKDIKTCIDTFINIVCTELNSSGKISIANLGTFKVLDTAARVGRNPQTGETIQVPAKKRIKFKAVPGLVEMVQA